VRGSISKTKIVGRGLTVSIGDGGGVKRGPRMQQRGTLMKDESNDFRIRDSTLGNSPLEKVKMKPK